MAKEPELNNYKFIFVKIPTMEDTNFVLYRELECIKILEELDDGCALYTYDEIFEQKNAGEL